MTHRRPSPLGAAASALLALALLAGCAADPAGGTAAPSPAAPSDVASPSATPLPTPTPTPTPVALPTDCRAILSDAVLAQLGDTPLNDPVMGMSTGVQSDGSLVCLWRDPRADITGLTTTISAMPRGQALGMLNRLADTEGFTCYTPDDGTRCEKTWDNARYPVTEGRTLFWRENVLIDTHYLNLAPTGYTDSIVAHLFG